MTRGFPSVALTTPNPEEEIAPLGDAKFGTFRELKNSARNSDWIRSVTGMRLLTETSMFLCPGPRMVLRPTLPKKLPGRVNAPDLKYAFRRRSVGPDKLPPVSRPPVAY